MSTPESIPEDKQQGFPCKCGGSVTVCEEDKQWQCDSCSFKRDVEKTKVVFKVEPNTAYSCGFDIMAVFVEELFNDDLYGKEQVVCYVHVGQHSGCAVDYYTPLENATQEQYADLQQELESLGYNLEVLNEETHTA